MTMDRFLDEKNIKHVIQKANSLKEKTQQKLNSLTPEEQTMLFSSSPSSREMQKETEEFIQHINEKVSMPLENDVTLKINNEALVKSNNIVENKTSNNVVENNILVKSNNTVRNDISNDTSAKSNNKQEALYQPNTLLLEKQKKAYNELLDLQVEFEIISRMSLRVEEKLKTSYQTKMASIQTQIREKELRLSTISNLLGNR